MEFLGLVAIGLVAGTLGSLLGLGGGFLVVPALILFKGLDPRLATGTAVAVIVPTMLVTLWRRGIQGHVDWRLAALIAVGAVAGAFIGSSLAGKLSALVIRRLFACVLLVLAGLLFFTDGRPRSESTTPSGAGSHAALTTPVTSQRRILRRRSARGPSRSGRRSSRRGRTRAASPSPRAPRGRRARAASESRMACSAGTGSKVISTPGTRARTASANSSAVALIAAML